MNYTILAKRLLITVSLVAVISSPFLLIRYTMVHQAKEVSGDEPYCIMVRFFHKYIKADILNIFIIPIGGLYKHHAVLMVGRQEYNKKYHWSYSRMTFMEGAKEYDGDPIYLPYKYDYDDLKKSDYSDIVKLKAHGREYSVPKIYRPKVVGDRLIISAQIPGLLPVGYDFNYKIGDSLITIEPKPDRLSRGRILVTPAGNEKIYRSFPELESGGFAHNLNKLNRALRHDSGFNLFYAKDNDEISTVISCFNVANMPCGHKFIRGNLIYGFSYMPLHLSGWKNLEEKIYQLVASFHETSAPNQSFHRTR